MRTPQARVGEFQLVILIVIIILILQSVCRLYLVEHRPGRMKIRMKIKIRIMIKNEYGGSVRSCCGPKCPRFRLPTIGDCRYHSPACVWLLAHLLQIIHYR